MEYRLWLKEGLVNIKKSQNIMKMVVVSQKIVTTFFEKEPHIELLFIFTIVLIKVTNLKTSCCYCGD